MFKTCERCALCDRSCFHQGNDGRIAFEDVLNDPYTSPVQPHTHKTMEQVGVDRFISHYFFFCFQLDMPIMPFVIRLQILKLPALERDGARSTNPLPFNDKI
jgi:hypothetical protein